MRVAEFRPYGTIRAETLVFRTMPRQSRDIPVPMLSLRGRYAAPPLSLPRARGHIGNREWQGGY
jgi:hypothetical protein